MNSIQKFYTILIATISTILTHLYGESACLIITLCGFFALDFVTGLFVAIYNDKKAGLSSSIGIKGLIKKCLILILICCIHQACIVLGIMQISSIVTISFIITETISIIENVGSIVKLPEVITKFIEVLNEKKRD